ncbi:hypothetical protein [Anaerosalibacter bizertensis]|uniref:hypothetical protein n=1 Tax=Anaerosalibacter bizertensis TaxID=932217 RepID=UPI00351372F5
MTSSSLNTGVSSTSFTLLFGLFSFSDLLFVLTSESFTEQFDFSAFGTTLFLPSLLKIAFTEKLKMKITPIIKLMKKQTLFY